MEYSSAYGNTTNPAAGNQGSPVLNMLEEKERLAEATKEVKQELLNKWKKKYANAEIFPPQVAAMHPEVVNFLLSFKLVSVYDSIAKQANLDAKGRDILPQVVWQAAKEKKLDQIGQILQTKIMLDPQKQALVLQLLQQNIISEIKIASEKNIEIKETAKTEEKRLIQLPLTEAIQQYPNIGEQGLTINQLKLKYFEAPVRPSIKNWITDFRDNMGGGKHGAVDRGNYIFHSENGKKLTPLERQKLSVILKSLDENVPLTIDPDGQVVIFENNEQSAINSRQQSGIDDQRPDYSNRQSIAGQGMNKLSDTKTVLGSDNYFNNFGVNASERAPSMESDSSTPGGSMRFVSPQTFSVEKKQTQGSQWDRESAKNLNNNMDEKPRNSGNIVNLKE